MVGITIGDPRGIGPEVIIKSILKLSQKQVDNIVLIGSIDLLKLWANYYNTPIKLSVYPERDKESIPVIDIGERFSNLEIPENVSSEIALWSIDKSIELLKKGEITSVVNGPVSKEKIAKILPSFRGHTGYYADAFSTRNHNMSFYSKNLKVVLVTDHIPLKDVPNSISYEKIKNTIINSYNWIKTLKKSEKIKIGICGLNPHAGENGKIGEEENIIKSVLKEFEFEIYGPLPPDTAFIEYRKKGLDCLIALYHDQGLIGFKLLHFDDGINVTIGFPFVRVSPAHGTAFDISGKGVANHRSMLKAIKYALYLEPKAKRQRQAPVDIKQV